MAQKIFRIELPVSNGTGKTTVGIAQSIVILGANGSGKTRLGTWIEFDSSHSNEVHRISAQKSLSMPEQSSTTSTEIAEISLYSGLNSSQIANINRVTTSAANFIAPRKGNRWGGKPNTFLLSDFANLMVLLFTDDYEQSAAYRRESRASTSQVAIPTTKLDIIKRVWEAILPHRELKISAGRVQARIKNSEVDFYNASEMSDGERVIFYLIGQALSAPKNGIIIIDEPELHLHKSIQTQLWREIQAAREDCLFIYMTHDVEFAASLTEAKKIWLKSFDGQLWEWEEVPTVESFPEELLLKILGSRKPILFVEGENGSYDIALFQSLYPDQSIIPRSSCAQVELATRALRQATEFHHIDAHGIIDRDRLNPNQIPRLKNEGVEVLGVAEVEHLFCVPEVLELVARQQSLPVEEKLKEAKDFVLRELQKEHDAQISLHVADEIKFRLNVFDVKRRGAQALKAELEFRTSNTNVDEIYHEIENRFDNVIQQQDYIGALALFNRKGLAKQISYIFGITNLPNFVLRMVQGNNSSVWLQAFSKYVPSLD